MTWSVHVSRRDDRFAMILDDEGDMVADLVPSFHAERIAAAGPKCKRCNGLGMVVRSISGGTGHGRYSGQMSQPCPNGCPPAQMYNATA